MTQERLAEIEARAEAIWTVEPFLLQKRIRQSQADIPDLIAEVKRLREAITPSEATKAAYMGEFQFRLGEFPTVNVPWVTIKEIMKAIEKRATEDNQG